MTDSAAICARARECGRGGAQCCSVARRGAARRRPASTPAQRTHLCGHGCQHIHAPTQDGDEVVLRRHDNRRHVLRRGGGWRRDEAVEKARTRERRPGRAAATAARARSRTRTRASRTGKALRLGLHPRADACSHRSSAPHTPRQLPRTHIALDALGHLLPKDLHGRAPRRARVMLLDNHLRGRREGRGGAAAGVAIEPASA